MAAEVPNDRNILQSRGRNNPTNGAPLAGSNLKGNQGIRTQQGGQFGPYRTIGRQSINAAVERQMRVKIPNLDAQRGYDAALNIRWIGHHNIKWGANCSPPISNDYGGPIVQFRSE